MAEEKNHIAVIQTPGMGHLIPLVEFSKRLINLPHHKFSVTLIIPNTGDLPGGQKHYLDSLPAAISHLTLPPVDAGDFASSGIEAGISLTIARSLPAIRNAVRSLLASSKHLVAMVTDLFGTDAFDVAEEFNIPCYIFYPPNATNLTIFLHMSELHKNVSCEFRDMKDPVQLPGCIPLNGSDLLDPLQDRKDDAYKWTLHHASRYTLAKGIMVNSFEDLEPGPIKALQEKASAGIFPPVYPVGPLTRLLSGDGDGEGDVDVCSAWLDNQPPGSVVFVSFGSGGTLSPEQLTELATGLELSGQRFIWVVRTPASKSNAAYFAHVQKDPLVFLPEGFLTRVKERGLVLANWAPQIKILRHASTGGFLTHCGWNSVLESVVCSVPLVAWPLYAEQRTNAVMLVNDLRVALRPEIKGSSGLVESVEIARVVTCLIEGEEGKNLRGGMRELKDSANKALDKDGSSTRALLELASKWKIKTKST